MRLFIALSLPAPALAETLQVSSRLQKGAQFTGCRLRWTPADSLHLTLAFLGDQPMEKLGAFDEILSRIAAAYPPQRLEIRSFGVFPHWKRPTALWAGIRDRTHRLADLHADLGRELLQLGCAAEERAFRPHITLARFKESRNVGAIEKLAHEQSGFRIGPFEADELTLWKSESIPEGALHAPLNAHKLCAPAAKAKEKTDASNDAA